MRNLLTTPPLAPIESVTDVLHGVSVTDPYRWLEAQNSDQTRRWLQNQNAYTRTCLDSIPGRDRVRKRIQDLLTIDVIDIPRKVGNRVFFMKREAAQAHAVITMREGLDGVNIPLVNPTTKFEAPSTSVSIVSISRG